MIRFNSTLTCMLAAAMALPAVAAPGRYAISPERIALVVSSAGMQVSPNQVTMLTNAVSSTQNPQLKVISIDRSYGSRAIARLECASHEQCLPFLVKLDVGAAAVSTPAASALSSASQARSSAPMVHSGAPAILLLEGPHVHITLPVICLENGALGQSIRAATRDHRLTYTARVIRDGVLEGSL